MLIYAASNGFLTNSLQLFYPVLTKEFGWDTVTVTKPASIMFIVGAFTSPIGGILLDRYSTRHVMTVGLFAIVVALFMFSRIQDHTDMMIIYVVFACGLSLGGMGSNMLVLTRWFKIRIGLATGLLLMCSSLGGAVFPKVLNSVMEQSDWRQALVVAAGIAAVMMLVPILALVRNHPEDVGEVIDGGVTDISGKNHKPNVGLTVGQALRQPRFYLLAFVTASLWFVIVSILQHQALYVGRDLGFSGADVAQFFSILFFCSVFGKLGFGVLSDYIDKHWSLIISTLVFSMGIYGLMQVSLETRTLLYFCAACIGLGFSGVFTNIQLLFAGYYAGAHYGKILGILVMIDSIAGGVGNTVVATMRDNSGSYDRPLTLMLSLLILSIFMVAFLFWRSRVTSHS